MVNTREPDPANDYSARYAQPVQETSSRPAATDDRNPVQMVAGLEKAASGNREVVVRLKTIRAITFMLMLLRAIPLLPRR